MILVVGAVCALQQSSNRAALDLMPQTFADARELYLLIYLFTNFTYCFTCLKIRAVGAGRDNAAVWLLQDPKRRLFAQKKSVGAAALAAGAAGTRKTNNTEQN